MKYNFVATAIYTSILTWIYSIEISVFWRYMRFEGEFDANVMIKILAGAIIITIMLPSGRDARTYILTCLHYFFFIPSLIYISFNDVGADYYLSFTICTLIVYLGSAISVRAIKVSRLRRSLLFFGLLVLVFTAVALQAAFGGLNSFNLDLESVYKFRSHTASSMPAIFGYLYSNVSNVLIPGLIILAVYYRLWSFAFIGITAGVLLFAMAHHKSILFTTVLIFVLFSLLNRYKSPRVLAIFPLAIVATCGLELIWLKYIQQWQIPGIVTSYLVRRALLVPPMLDAASIELFYDAPKYFWSTSRLGFGIAENPYHVAAPFLIGTELFADPTMSANAGLIGSGYSQAGLAGTTAYSILMAMIVSFINTVGKRAGMELIAALSFPTIQIIFTSTDFTTALLTHGLLVLLILISVLPKSTPLTAVPARE